MNVTGISPAASAYAQAIIELASESGDVAKADELGEELAQVAKLVKGDDLFRAFLADPSISTADRAALINNVFGAGRASELLVNTLGVLNVKNRLALIPEIAVAYAELLDLKRNRVRVTVTVAKELNDQELGDVRDRISKGLAREAII